MVDQAFDDARAASDALAAAESQGRKRRREAKLAKDALVKSEPTEPAKSKPKTKKTKIESNETSEKKSSKKVVEKKPKSSIPASTSSATVSSTSSKVKDKNEDELELTAESYFDNIVEYEECGAGAALSIALIQRLARRFSAVRKVLIDPPTTDLYDE